MGKVCKEGYSLVPFHGRAHDLDKRERDLGVPLLWALEDEIVERFSNFRVLAVVLYVQGNRREKALGCGDGVEWAPWRS